MDRRRATALLLGATLAAGAAVAQAPSAGAEGPRRVVTVDVGIDLQAKGAGGETVSAVSLRFFPSQIDVHRGDLVRFRSSVRQQTIALLPPAVQDPKTWIDQYAFGFDHPWFPVTLDPDETWAKMNNAVVFPPFPPPPCGASSARPCRFPMSPESAAQQDTRWGFSAPTTDEQLRGVLGSGMPAPATADPGAAPRPTLDLWVEIDGEPGTTVHAVQLFAKQGTARITVVPDDQRVPAQSELDAARDRQVEVDRATVSRLDREHANLRSGKRLVDGTTQWHALAGLEEGPVAIRQAYPRTLSIRAGDSVLWSPAKVENLVHTVSFGHEARNRPPFETVCDLDGDSDAGSYPDQKPIDEKSPSFPFCAGGHSQVEFDLNDLIGPKSGDGAFRGGSDLDSSGVMGMAPKLEGVRNYQDIDPSASYPLTFPVASGAEGFDYVCALHGEMKSRVVVR